MASPFDLAGKTAIVTGASSGIGQAIAVALATAGARVAGVARSSQDQTAAAVRDMGSDYLAIKADLASIEPVERIVDEASAWAGRADILINNAGILRRADPLEFSEKDWDDVINLDLKSVFFLAQAFAKRALARGGAAKIVNVASILAFVGGIRVPSYVASKHGVGGITKLLANEWAGKGINVNAIAPGYVRTEATQALQDDPVRNERLLLRIPAGRWGEPADIGGAAVFLSSRAADYCHGTILVVDGGWLAG
ncbi:MAG: 2-dehydro-3-deoxy-D-gluconate 5-dehydrogenase KduD [Alphaproteobacteria bacterium]